MSMSILYEIQRDSLNKSTLHIYTYLKLKDKFVLSKIHSDLEKQNKNIE